jgi:hypothetical protein
LCTSLLKIVAVLIIAWHHLRLAHWKAKRESSRIARKSFLIVMKSNSLPRHPLDYLRLLIPSSRPACIDHLTLLWMPRPHAFPSEYGDRNSTLKIGNTLFRHFVFAFIADSADLAAAVTKRH